MLRKLIIFTLLLNAALFTNSVPILHRAPTLKDCQQPNFMAFLKQLSAAVTAKLAAKKGASTVSTLWRKGNVQEAIQGKQQIEAFLKQLDTILKYQASYRGTYYYKWAAEKHKRYLDVLAKAQTSLSRYATFKQLSTPVTTWDKAKKELAYEEVAELRKEATQYEKEITADLVQEDSQDQSEPDTAVKHFIINDYQKCQSLLQLSQSPSTEEAQPQKNWRARLPSLPSFSLPSFSSWGSKKVDE